MQSSPARRRSDSVPAQPRGWSAVVPAWAFEPAFTVVLEPRNALLGQLNIQRYPVASVALQLVGIAPFDMPVLPPGQLYVQKLAAATLSVQLPAGDFAGVMPFAVVFEPPVTAFEQS